MADGASIEKNWRCSRCGHEGSVIMEGRLAIAADGDFYLKLHSPLGGAYQIACSYCGAIQPYPNMA